MPASGTRAGRSRRVENSPDSGPPASTPKASSKPADPPTGPPPQVAPADPDEKPAPNVIVALCRVMRDLPGIGKDRHAAPQQGGYAYRGIDQITPHTQALFARHGVLLAPRIVRWEIRPVTVGGNPWTDVVQEVEYDVYGPGGPDDKIVVGPLLALGRDNSDKGANKCLTQAMKYALIQVLQISDGSDDADGTTNVASSVEGHHRAQGAPPAPGDDAPKFIDRAEVDRLLAIVKALPEDGRQMVREQWTHVDPLDDKPFLPVDDEGRPHFGLLTPNMVSAFEAMIARIQRTVSGRQQAPQPPPPSAGPETPPDTSAPQENDEQAPTSWNEIIDGVRLLTEEQLIADLDHRGLLEEDMEPAKMRAVLVNDIGTKAGLSLNTVADALTKPTATEETSEETPPDTA